MTNKTPRWLASLAILPVFWLAGCSDAVTSPDALPVLDNELVLFVAEATGTPPTSAAAPSQERVAAAVAHAKSVLQRARDFLQTQRGVSPEVRALLTQADRACQRAEASLGDGNAAMTIRAAMVCANQAREAVFLARAERMAAMQDRANSAVAEAQRLMAAAAPLVGEGAPEGAKVQLAVAQRALDSATQALEAGRFAEAIARATQVSVIAERIIRVLG
jgi:hypothetical protein